MSDIESRMLEKGLIKVPVDEKPKESPYRRVAKFLFIIGTEQAAGVLKQLTKEQVDKVVAELVTIQSIDKSEALQILNEFNAVYTKNKNSLGGVETAKTMLTEAFGSTRAEEILENAVPEKKPVPFEYLQGMSGENLTRILAGELPSSKAIVLSQLEAKQAAEYISSLSDEEEKKEIVLRLAKMQKLNSGILYQVSEALKKKMVDVNLNKTASIDGVSVLAEILRQVDYKTGSNILDSIKEQDENLAGTISDKLVTLDDIIKMNPKHIQYLISPMTGIELARLIHAKSPEFRKAILSNLSKTRAALVLQEEEFISPILKKELNEAADSFLAKIRAEAEKGRIILNFNEEEYV
ncbi:flagellar motor switch protein FliG [Treponema pedis]|uniref:Flagellar motor switch protein FliG n=1 Tax=Treponema pedis str. T A4 TaxID=1291379 RepID=S6A9B1_9SPIR|nr:FliG C-terminal domain-containing protein [Treponema pedis]AGT45264.1 flagellar motor switch protein FliG [Treponema pedis str. T A4]